MFAGFRLDDENSTTSLPDDTDEQVFLDTIIEDSGGYIKHETAGNYAKVPDGGAGVYLLGGELYLSDFVTECFVQIQLSRGGSNFAIGKAVAKAATAVEVGAVIAAFPYRLVAGDELRLFAHQISGGVKTTNWTGSLNTTMFGLYVGP